MNTLFLKKPNSRSPGSRHKRIINSKVFGVSRKVDKTKHNFYSKSKTAGRNHHGNITVHGRGGGVKKLQRKILPLQDFIILSTKYGVVGEQRSSFILTSIEKVPGKGRGFVGLFTPLNCPKLPEFYLLCSQGISVGTIISNVLPGEYVHSFKKGFVAPIAQIPQNNYAFNVELQPGSGTKFARAAGSRVYLQGVDITGSNENIIVKLPSGQL